MNVIATFEKVSLDEYRKSYDQIGYDHVKLPSRATSGSAGYDFYMTSNLNLKPGESVIIRTYIKCRIDAGWVLMLFPRSSLGFKYHVSLANTVGIIDSDYYGNDNNEGHIMIKLTNNGEKTVEFSAGDKFCQGIFLPYGITTNDHETDKEVRSGGFGSTGK